MTTRAILPAALALGLAALLTVAPAGPAVSSTEAGAGRTAARDVVKGWPAVAGLTGREVVAPARTLSASTEAAPDKPWCDAAAAVDRQLDQEFAESLVSHQADGTQLWGSPLMGTWTVVLARPDRTSCIVASGIGFADGVNPNAYLARVGLAG